MPTILKEKGMNKMLILASILLSTQSVLAGIKVVYGTDDRKDLYSVSNALHLKLAKSTAGMVSVGAFGKSLTPRTFDLTGTQTLERAQNLCTSEKFLDQPLAPICSGFLVGPDTLVTAGHCFNSQGTPEQNCKNFAWIFNYEIPTFQSDPTKNISIDNIYLCRGVVQAFRDTNYDFAVIKLNRRVVGREPLKFRTAGKIADRTPLVVIGHPNGLPKKITANGRLTYNSEPTRFSTTLDTFHGNSGAAVFDASTGLVEGILIMGKNDYRPSIPSNPKSCQIVNVCDDNAGNCAAGAEEGPISRGEVVLRISTIAQVIQKALAIK